MKRLLLFAMAVLLSFVGVTYVALESGGVVVVRTTDAETSVPRDTHVWFVAEGNRLLLEAGNPQNPWVDDLAGMNTLKLSGEGLDGEYRFRVLAATSREDIRLMMRRKYGWRDWWVDLLFDTSQSAAVELSRIVPQTSS